jgi:DNA-binding protein HU-beta
MPIHGLRAVLVLVCEQPPFPLTMLDNLLSKVIAAGLAAGVFLLWWPAHLPSAGVPWLVLRGLAWTLAFEILVLSFVPFERMATRALVRRREGGRAARVRPRLAAAPAPARASGAVMLAFTGLLLPGLLLLHSGRLPAAQPVAHTTKVVRKVVVRKVVRERTVVVREAAPAPAPNPVSAATAAPVAVAPKRAAKQSSTSKAAAPSTKPAAKKTTSTPAAATKTPTAAPPVLPDPAAAAAPATSDAAPADATAAAG